MSTLARAKHVVDSLATATSHRIWPGSLAVPGPAPGTLRHSGFGGVRSEHLQITSLRGFLSTAPCLGSTESELVDRDV